MPGFLLHVGAGVTCAHGAKAAPSTPNQRVLVNGMATVTAPTPYLVTGCTLPPPPAANGPCLTAQFMSAATRIVSNGQPLLLFDSQAICAPTGTPLKIIVTQMRVTGI